MVISLTKEKYVCVCMRAFFCALYSIRDDRRAERAATANDQWIPVINRHCIDLFCNLNTHTQTRRVIQIGRRIRLGVDPLASWAWDLMNMNGIFNIHICAQAPELCERLIQSVCVVCVWVSRHVNTHPTKLPSPPFFPLSLGTVCIHSL